MIIIVIILISLVSFTIVYWNIFAKSKKFLGEGYFWFYIAQSIVYDPPGDHSNETLFTSFNGSSIITSVIFDISSSINLEVVPKYITSLLRI